MASSTYRDRTSEFISLSKTLNKITRNPLAIPSLNNDEKSPLLSNTNHNNPSLDRSDFNRKASRIGLSIHQTFQKIERLSKLTKMSSMFNDPSKEIQELTALVKNDISSLNVAVSDLLTLQNIEVADGNYSEDRVVHSTAVCDDLKNRLMGATKQFQEVLTTRTKNIKAHESRKQIFSTNVSRENPLRQTAKTVAEPPPWSNPADPGQGMQPSESSANGVQASNQLRRRLGADSTSSQQLEMSMLQQSIPRQEDYSQSRAVALQNVESTISELGGIFTHLATMVAHQGELAIRIDDNTEETLANVEGARSALLRHLSRISSNRWLLIKIFLILIFFLTVFIFFLA